MGFPASMVPTWNAFQVELFNETKAKNTWMLHVKAMLDSAGIRLAANSEKSTITISELGDITLKSFEQSPSLQVCFGTLSQLSEIDKFTSVKNDCIVLLTQSSELLFAVHDHLSATVGAVVAFNNVGEASWFSRNTLFGNSNGHIPSLQNSGMPENVNVCSAGFFGGMILAVIEELLSENIYNKTSIYLDRVCLEMRPLHLRLAVEKGLTAQMVFGEIQSKSWSMDSALKQIKLLYQKRMGPTPKGWGIRR